MSINDFTNKIKNKLDIDTFTMMCLLVIILVGIGSFGLGRLSIGNNTTQARKIEIKNINNQLGSAEKINLNSSNQDNLKREKNYVASKNGKLYYTIECSGAKRINPENQIWFQTIEEAEKSGYEFSNSCK